MSDRRRRETIMQMVVQRLDVRINKLVTIRNRIQDMVEFLQAEADKDEDETR
jgi:hypothetical protein